MYPILRHSCAKRNSYVTPQQLYQSFWGKTDNLLLFAFIGDTDNFRVSLNHYNILNVFTIEARNNKYDSNTMDHVIKDKRSYN